MYLNSSWYLGDIMKKQAKAKAASVSKKKSNRKTFAQREFNVVVERDADGYYVASVAELPGCHTQAKSMDTLLERTKEAIELCLETTDQLSEPTEFVGVQRVAVNW